MPYVLDKGSHSVYTLSYHYICCVKYRQKIFDADDIIDRLKQINIDIADQFGVVILNQETDQDHIHILFKSTPKIDLTKFINSLKGVSARRLFQEFPRITSKLWNGHLWSPSYFLATTGQVTLDILKQYVESQGGETKITDVEKVDFRKIKQSEIEKMNVREVKIADDKKSIKIYFENIPNEILSHADSEQYFNLELGMNFFIDILKKNGVRMV